MKSPLKLSVIADFIREKKDNFVGLHYLNPTYKIGFDNELKLFQ